MSVVSIVRILNFAIEAFYIQFAEIFVLDSDVVWKNRIVAVLPVVGSTRRNDSRM